MNVAAAWPTFVDQSAGEAGRWPWTRARHSNGYGQFRENGQTVYVHRRVAEAKIGRRLTAGEVVRHTCDNPPCCNPEHLLVGTQADNLRDMAVRGRVGSALTADQVAEIKRLRYRHHRVELAASFGVDPATISDIFAGRSWAHVVVDPLCSTPGCERVPRPNTAICDADVLDVVAPAPRPAQQPDLADVALGPVASRDGAAGSTEAPCPAASPIRRGASPRLSPDIPIDQRLFCTCGGELRIVAVGGPRLRLGHTANPREKHHYPRLARPRTP